MSKTLFWYVMKDLLKVFLMASGVLAGIMSFGGLLKPLMQFGLSGWQVTQMLLYFMPATQTYSLPIAALFATTIVYGRLSADNELNACRAHGISYLTMAIPAFILGLVLSLVSLVCLSYVVPKFTLKVEKVAFQSLADVVQKSITRTHQLKLQGFVIYAESAERRPPDPDRPDDEVVILHGPMFATYDQRIEADNKRVNVPSEFFTARSAIAFIHQGEDRAEFTAYLDQGTSLPRELKGSTTLGGIGVGQFGPVILDSIVRENSKFMDIRQLKEIHKDPSKSREVRNLYSQITRQEQEQAFLTTVVNALKAEPHEYVFRSDEDAVTLKLEKNIGRLPRVQKNKLTITSRGAGTVRDIHLTRSRGDETISAEDAWQIDLRVAADSDGGRMRIQFEMNDVTTGVGADRTARTSLSRPFSMPMPPELRKIEARGPRFYLSKKISARSDDPRGKLARKMTSLSNTIEAEIHSRASFAMSCLILVMVGCALGMMFKTGNYLSAFALSVVPALISIALVVTGQHVSENAATNALKLGLTLIWAGNLVVLALAVGLLAHLRRQ